MGAGEQSTMALLHGVRKAYLRQYNLKVTAQRLGEKLAVQLTEVGRTLASRNSEEAGSAGVW